MSVPVSRKDPTTILAARSASNLSFFEFLTSNSRTDRRFFCAGGATLPWSDN
jgi:hypothetical protein